MFGRLHKNKENLFEAVVIAYRLGILTPHHHTTTTTTTTG